jgi:hypothetical protein
VRGDAVALQRAVLSTDCGTARADPFRQRKTMSAFSPSRHPSAASCSSRRRSRTGLPRRAAEPGRAVGADVALRTSTSTAPRRRRPTPP